MTPVGFETTISTGERPQTYALDRAATGTGNSNMTVFIFIIIITTIIFIIISLFPSLHADSAANGAMQNLESVNFNYVQKLNGRAFMVNEGIEIPFRLIYTIG